MAQSDDLPRFVISKVEDVARPPEADQQPSSGGAEDRSTDTPVNGKTHTFHSPSAPRLESRKLCPQIVSKLQL